MSVPPKSEERRLTPAQIMLVVVVSVLVLVLVVLLVQRLGSGGEAPATTPPPAATSTTAPPESPEQTATEPPEGGASTEAAYFASPTGNIACQLTEDAADCVIASFSYEPDDLGSCEAEPSGEGERGGHLRVEPAGASMPCEPLVVAGDVPVLDYGESTEAHGYRCTSEESGVSCRHTESGYGFSVARAEYDLF